MVEEVRGHSGAAAWKHQATRRPITSATSRKRTYALSHYFRCTLGQHIPPPCLMGSLQSRPCLHQFWQQQKIGKQFYSPLPPVDGGNGLHIRWPTRQCIRGAWSRGKASQQ